MLQFSRDCFRPAEASRGWLQLPFALLLTLAFAPGAYGQLATTTSLVGDVTDTAGSVMAGVTISSRNEATNETYTTITNGSGYYEIQYVKPATYSITAHIAGFETIKTTGVIVESNQIVRTNFTMPVGQVSETLTVTGSAPPIATDDATVSETLNQKSTGDLPLNGRDSLKLAIITPGVIPGLKAASSLPGGGEDFIGPGVREVQNSVTLDGISILTNLVSTTSIRPSVDAIQEVQVLTGTYPAQYGGYMGVQIIEVTKSGTNSLHGSVFEFLRNNWFDARGFFNAVGTPQAPFHQNQFGFEVGGPVIIPKLYNGKNKTFFMADYEGLRNASSVPAITTEPTSLMRQGNFSELLTAAKPVIIHNPLDPARAPFPGNIIPAAMLSPQALAGLKYLPLPNEPGVLNNYVVNAVSGNHTDQTIDRIDQSIGEKMRFFFRYAWENSSLLAGVANPFNGYNQIVTDRNFVIGYTQVVSPKMVNDFRFGRQHTGIDSVSFFATPALANAGTLLGIPGFTSSTANPGLPDLSITGYDAVGGGKGTWRVRRYPKKTSLGRPATSSIGPMGRTTSAPVSRFTS